ncbi:hypothetical protein [Mycobacterium asiaticum]|uniref:hypothetical protein n=1 Tax=Mycobacterium asiaticum TaxID=1790 RepID=UPI0012DB3951|nr:hypothetical protein [Mycobacterium asiaticum]
MHELVQDERRQIVERVRIVDEDHQAVRLRAVRQRRRDLARQGQRRAFGIVGLLRESAERNRAAVVVAATLRTIQPAAAVAVTTS